MKIALITDGIYPYVMGGMQKHSFYVAKFLAKNKVYVDLYYYVDIRNTDIQDPFDEKELKFINIIKVDYPKLRKFPGHYLYERYKYSDEILKLLVKLPLPDFIYAKGFASWSLLRSRKKLKIDVPVGLNFHGYEMFQRWPDVKTGLHLQILKLPVFYHMRKADYLFSYGGKISQLIAIKGFKNKIIEIPTGIDKSWIREGITAQTQMLNFVFVGRAERRKGIIEINNVLSRLEHNFNFRIHFVGPIEDSLKSNDQRAEYYGPVYDAEVLKSILDKMDVLICPSHSEGMPNVIMEGMARGLAIIATDVGAVSEMVTASNGWLLNANKIEDELFLAINEVLGSLNLKELKEQSISQAKKLQWNKVIKHLINQIEAINRNYNR